MKQQTGARNEREANQQMAETETHARVLCPPCTGDCFQGRECPADGPARRRGRDAEALVVVIALATFWGVVALMVRGCT